jgi:hypothetical protein
MFVLQDLTVVDWCFTWCIIIYFAYVYCGLVVEFLATDPDVSGFDSRRYQVFCVAVGLKRGPLNLVRINEELLERKVASHKNMDAGGKTITDIRVRSKQLG